MPCFSRLAVESLESRETPAGGTLQTVTFTYTVSNANAAESGIDYQHPDLYMNVWANTVYVGTANGGVWKTTNGGKSW